MGLALLRVRSHFRRACSLPAQNIEGIITRIKAMRTGKVRISATFISSFLRAYRMSFPTNASFPVFRCQK